MIRHLRPTFSPVKQSRAQPRPSIPPTNVGDAPCQRDQNVEPQIRFAADAADGRVRYPSTRWRKYHGVNTASLPLVEAADRFPPGFSKYHEERHAQAHPPPHRRRQRRHPCGHGGLARGWGAADCHLSRRATVRPQSSWLPSFTRMSCSWLCRCRDWTALRPHAYIKQRRPTTRIIVLSMYPHYRVAASGGRGGCLPAQGRDR